MWLNPEQTIDSKIVEYRESLLRSCPNHVVIDGLFNEDKLGEVMSVLQQAQHWQTQLHTYTALYVDSIEWQNTRDDQRFVQRDVWKREAISSNIAQEFLSFLREGEFMSMISRIFSVPLTDLNVTEPEKNTNYFRLGLNDFIEQHADDSPGREVCMLLYLNKEWNPNAGGELGFLGEEKDNPIHISPTYNRCVLFNPSSEGSEHWVEQLNAEYTDKYRYNVTSWYWSE
jgi:Rps23 Pro-64 3,4-dihydroxylase Tpa1-like proline 4-hydroxylase